MDIREKITEVIKAYESIIDSSEVEEYEHLISDLVSITYELLEA